MLAFGLADQCTKNRWTVRSLLLSSLLLSSSAASLQHGGLSLSPSRLLSVWVPADYSVDIWPCLEVLIPVTSEDDAIVRFVVTSGAAITRTFLPHSQTMCIATRAAQLSRREQRKTVCAIAPAGPVSEDIPRNYDGVVARGWRVYCALSYTAMVAVLPPLWVERAHWPKAKVKYEPGTGGACD